MARKKRPAVKGRVIWSVLVAFLASCIIKIHDALRATLDAKIAVSQLNDSVAEYTFIQLWLSNSLVPFFTVVGALLILAAIWWAHLDRLSR